MNLIVFDLEWNIGYQPKLFNYHGFEQTLRGEIIQIGAVKINLDANVLDTFRINLKPRIFRKLQHHIAKVTGLTQADLDTGVPIAAGLRRFAEWAGPDACFAEWGMDDVPVLKQNLFLYNQDENWPYTWYDLQQIFLQQYPRREGDGMTLESVVQRLEIPMDRPFHDALADSLYTVDVCRKLDLRAGIAAYPDEAQQLRESLCPDAEGDYRDFLYKSGYLDREAFRTLDELQKTPCPLCGAILEPDEVWLKRGNTGYYTLARCPRHGGMFQRYKIARRDGLHWSVARCVEMPRPEQLQKWERQRRQALERLARRAEKAAQAAEGREKEEA